MAKTKTDKQPANQTVAVELTTLGDIYRQVQQAGINLDGVEQCLTHEGHQTSGIQSHGCYCLAAKVETSRDILANLLEQVKILQTK